MSENNCAHHGPYVVEDCQVRDRGDGKMFLRLQEIRVEILSTMGKKHHQCHQKHEVGENSPVTGGGAHNCAYAGRAMLFPGFRFTDFESNIESQQSGRASYPKHGTP